MRLITPVKPSIVNRKINPKVHNKKGVNFKALRCSIKRLIKNASVSDNSSNYNNITSTFQHDQITDTDSKAWAATHVIRPTY